MPLVPILALPALCAALTGVPIQPPPATGPIDLIERLFGASDVAYVIGNGGLTIGLSPLGEAAVLSWPSPSYTDQLLHLGSNDPDVRRARNMAASDAMGAFIGLRLTRGDRAPEVVFPRKDWVITQRYDPAPVLVTTMTPKDGPAGLAVEVADWVDPDSDVWIREVRVSGDAAVTGVEVLGYWNLSPTVSRIPQLPLADWAMDAYNDYAALWDADAHAVVHFRPSGRGDLTQLTDLVVRPAIDYGPVGQALAAGPLDDAAASALLAGPEGLATGAFLAVGARETVVAHQIGIDPTPTCDLVGALADNVAALPDLYPGLALPLDPSLVDILRCDRTAAGIATENGWSDLPRGAFEDLQDGELSGSSGAAGQVDEALVVAAARGDDGRWVARLVVGAGVDRAAAEAALAAGRSASMATTTSRWATETSAIRWPSSPTLRAASERALTNLLMAQDRHTGAIVASVARQPPYALDWPRDGAFFDYALDLAGLPERATKHARYTMTTQAPGRCDGRAAHQPRAAARPRRPDEEGVPGRRLGDELVRGRAGRRQHPLGDRQRRAGDVDAGRARRAPARGRARRLARRGVAGGRARREPLGALARRDDRAARAGQRGRQRGLHPDPARRGHHLARARVGGRPGRAARRRGRARLARARRRAAPGHRHPPTRPGRHRPI
ncbi:MAG: hypothetical protein U1F43_33510 [Myxococcota bacterium]